MKLQCDRCRMEAPNVFMEGDMCRCGAGRFKEVASANFTMDTLNEMIGKFPPIPRAPEMMTSPYLTVLGRQMRVPRSRRGRIRKKWAKRKANYEIVPDPHFYMLGEGKCVCHPELLRVLKEKMRKETDAHRQIQD